MSAKNPPASKIKMPKVQTKKFKARYFFRMRKKIGRRNTRVKKMENTRVSLWLKIERIKRQNVIVQKNILEERA